ncbi:MAG: hypothetical protein L3J71_00495 [Victivallaceae bacterium]|nr:hypothetical protein [Victivallaceae bacterium]
MSKFSKKCKYYFSFLISEFGCSYELEISIYGTTIYYVNHTSCVKIVEEKGDLFISLAKLKDKKVPEYTTKTGSKNKVNYIDLLVIIKQKNENDYEYYNTVFNVKRKKIDFKLEELSKALKLYAEDFLKGDFTVFNSLI